MNNNKINTVHRICVIGIVFNLLKIINLCLIGISNSRNVQISTFVLHNINTIATDNTYIECNFSTSPQKGIKYYLMAKASKIDLLAN